MKAIRANKGIIISAVFTKGVTGISKKCNKRLWEFQISICCGEIVKPSEMQRDVAIVLLPGVIPHF